MDGSSINRLISSPSDRFKTPESARRSLGSSGRGSLEVQRTYQSGGEVIDEQQGFEYDEPMIDQSEIYEGMPEQQQDYMDDEGERRESENRRSKYIDAVEKLKDSIENNQLEIDGNLSPLDEDYDGLTESAKHRRSQSLLNKRKKRKTQFDEETELSEEIVRKMKNVDIYSDSDEENDEENDDDDDDDGNTPRRRRRDNNNNNNNNGNNNIDNIIKKRKYKKPEYSKFINPMTAFIRALPKMKKLPRDEDNDDIEEIDLMQLGIDDETDGVDDNFEFTSTNNNNNNNQQPLSSPVNDTMQQTPIINTSVNGTVSYLDGPTFNETLDDMYDMNNNDYNENDMMINEEDTIIINKVNKDMEIVNDLKQEFEENSVVEFQQMVNGKTKRNIASDFLGLLTLAANDYVIANQNNPFDTIEVRKGQKWSEFESDSD